MRLIEIEELPNGGHRNMAPDEPISPPEGWAVIPSGLETPNFPFGRIATEQVEGMETVTSWDPREIPAVNEETV